MICILHGYLLEGSGSNLWTRSIVESLCRQGHDVHLMAQENHPERYDFITEARRYREDGEVETFFRRGGVHPGCCVLHKPDLGDTLPVYVWDRYEEFSRVVPMVELSDDEVEAYVARNQRALRRIVQENGITAMHANHAVLMSVVAQRVSQETGVPFAVMPHGSALEFAVKRDERFLRLAEEAFTAARRVFAIGDEMRERVRGILGGVPGLEEKFSGLHLGVDTSRFELVPRSARRATIARMRESLADVPRGKTAAQSAALRGRLRGDLRPEEMRELFAAADAAYEAKAPDADVEAKLDDVRWETDPTLLFVGRLISTKGIQGVIAALPLILAERPELRLLVVGHGPLREPLEGLLWALEHGQRGMVERIVARGRELEGSPEGEGEGVELTQVARFLEQLDARGELDAYYAAAREHVRPDRVVFTGYLTHRELRYLFPCCDAAVFPSVVKEAGPLVFLEALASGAFPLGTYFAGMKASIDSVAAALPPEDAEAMKLNPAPERTVADIVRHVPAALALSERHRETLYRLARDRYDWKSVAAKLYDELNAL
ncbi:MAG: glycosyltransferase [Gemmatimonadetes bacterium]|nr:glycosyltransferase [Gemmatimonadota bacterium]